MIANETLYILHTSRIEILSERPFIASRTLDIALELTGGLFFPVLLFGMVDLKYRTKR